MEAAAIMKMVEDEFRDSYFIIYFIINNDDSTMQSVLMHPSIGSRGQVLNSSKLKIDE